VSKHICSVYFSLNLKQKALRKVRLVIEAYNLDGCPECGSSDVVKIGLRHNSYSLSLYRGGI
jgi:hypothetical protein